MEYPPVFEPGSYSLCGNPADQTVSPGDHDQDRGNDGHLGVESHVVFTVAQAGVTHSAPNISQKLLPLPETPPSGTSQEKLSGSAREYLLSQQSMEVSGYGSSSGVGSCLSPPASVRHHIIVAAQTTSHTFHSSDSPQNIYVSAPLSNSISHHQHINTLSPHPIASPHQSLYVTTPVHPLVQQSTNISQPSASNIPLMKNSTDGDGKSISQYMFGSPRQTVTVTSPEDKASHPTKPQRSSISLTPTKPHLPEPSNSSPNNKDVQDRKKETSA